MEESHRIKMAMIASASKVLDFKKRNPGKSDDEALKFIVKNLDSMLNESHF